MFNNSQSNKADISAYAYCKNSYFQIVGCTSFRSCECTCLYSYEQNQVKETQIYVNSTCSSLTSRACFLPLGWRQNKIIHPLSTQTTFVHGIKSRLERVTSFIPDLHSTSHACNCCLKNICARLCCFYIGRSHFIFLIQMFL